MDTSIKDKNVQLILSARDESWFKIQGSWAAYSFREENMNEREKKLMYCLEQECLLLGEYGNYLKGAEVFKNQYNGLKESFFGESITQQLCTIYDEAIKRLVKKKDKFSEQYVVSLYKNFFYSKHIIPEEAMLSLLKHYKFISWDKDGKYKIKIGYGSSDDIEKKRKELEEKHTNIQLKQRFETNGFICGVIETVKKEYCQQILLTDKYITLLKNDGIVYKTYFYQEYNLRPLDANELSTLKEFFVEKLSSYIIDSNGNVVLDETKLGDW